MDSKQNVSQARPARKRAARPAPRPVVRRPLPAGEVDGALFGLDLVAGGLF